MFRQGRENDAIEEFYIILLQNVILIGVLALNKSCNISLELKLIGLVMAVNFII